MGLSLPSRRNWSLTSNHLGKGRRSGIWQNQSRGVEGQCSEATREIFVIFGITVDTTVNENAWRPKLATESKGFKSSKAQPRNSSIIPPSSLINNLSSSSSLSRLYHSTPFPPHPRYLSLIRCSFHSSSFISSLPFYHDRSSTGGPGLGASWQNYPRRKPFGKTVRWMPGMIPFPVINLMRQEIGCFKA